MPGAKYSRLALEYLAGGLVNLEALIHMDALLNVVAPFSVPVVFGAVPVSCLRLIMVDVVGVEFFSIHCDFCIIKKLILQ